jgi:hypothetical protein
VGGGDLVGNFWCDFWCDLWCDLGGDLGVIWGVIWKVIWGGGGLLQHLKWTPAKFEMYTCKMQVMHKFVLV